MFKKLVVGALATGIALTGGIGAASASTTTTENTVSPKTELNTLDSIFKRDEIRYDNRFANYFYQNGVHWYLKGIEVKHDKEGKVYYVGHYEGRKG
ncbi:LCI fold-containing protein [Bacillus cytotoxicus]|uniref:LCI fold-containing protein n=1 Tax=Bacillus cereus group sp. BfR-BA-01492 TaxID=2920361 RepID=UPI001F5A3BAF|nr:LCI fold-containing protein [Bacillus cereus group sp. BfR-BA-01492]EMA6343933.1 hypothetical protein [Bacillus cytotoxicus]